MIDQRTMEQMCNEARDAVGLPLVYWALYDRWGQQLDCESCPANVACAHYALMWQVEGDVDELRRFDA